MKLTSVILLLLLEVAIAQRENFPDLINPTGTAKFELATQAPGLFELEEETEKEISAIPVQAVIANISIIQNVEVLRDQQCSAIIANSTIGINTKIPPFCCNFGTRECYYNNGTCKLRWETGCCDYTIDACPRLPFPWLCTCCASCENLRIRTQCSNSGGTCRRCCEKHEYHAYWRKCQHGNCRCCKEYCPQKSCANGRGTCLHKSQERPAGHYLYGSCGFNCDCWVPCNDGDCDRPTGFCEWRKVNCPVGYTTSRCLCGNSADQCRCCKRNSGGPISTGSGGRVKVRNMMEVEFGGGAPPPPEAEPRAEP